MGVDVQGDADRGVSEAFLDDLGAHGLTQEHRRLGAPRVVRPTLKADLLEDADRRPPGTSSLPPAVSEARHSLTHLRGQGRYLRWARRHMRSSGGPTPPPTATGEARADESGSIAARRPRGLRCCNAAPVWLSEDRAQHPSPAAERWPRSIAAPQTPGLRCCNATLGPGRSALRGAFLRRARQGSAPAGAGPVRACANTGRTDTLLPQDGVRAQRRRWPSCRLTDTPKTVRVATGGLIGTGDH